MSAAATLVQVDALLAGGRGRAAIDALRRANREVPDPRLEKRLAEVRYASFATLDARPGFDEWPVPLPDHDGGGPAYVPEISRAELAGDVARREVVEHGCLRVNGLLGKAQIDQLVTDIDRALEVRSEPEPGSEQSWYAPLPLPREEAQTLGRNFVKDSGGVLAADSPRLLDRLLEVFEDAGLRSVVRDYLGEPPVLSANKCTLRRVPVNANTGWHQDGAFLGHGIRALNIWVALSDCGIDSPGIDVLPRRLDDIVETGTGGAIFDWSVGPDVVEQLAVDSPVVRPQFRAGDGLLFDDLCLHRTGVDSTMTRPRYGIEAWFFAPSSYPAGQVPIVW
jgi:Phytanoyl-CoA dioxygenase (PhyH)